MDPHGPVDPGPDSSGQTSPLRIIYQLIKRCAIIISSYASRVSCFSFFSCAHKTVGEAWICRRQNGLERAVKGTCDSQIFNLRNEWLLIRFNLVPGWKRQPLYISDYHQHQIVKGYSPPSKWILGQVVDEKQQIPTFLCCCFSLSGCSTLKMAIKDSIFKFQFFFSEVWSEQKSMFLEIHLPQFHHEIYHKLGVQAAEPTIINGEYKWVAPMSNARQKTKGFTGVENFTLLVGVITSPQEL